MKKRRNLIKALSVASTAGAIETWKKPVVSAIMLPAHATTTDDDTTEEPCVFSQTCSLFELSLQVRSFGSGPQRFDGYIFRSEEFGQIENAIEYIVAVDAELPICFDETYTLDPGFYKVGFNFRAYEPGTEPVYIVIADGSASLEGHFCCGGERIDLSSYTNPEGTDISVGHTVEIKQDGTCELSGL